MLQIRTLATRTRQTVEVDETSTLVLVLQFYLFVLTWTWFFAFALMILSMWEHKSARKQFLQHIEHKSTRVSENMNWIKSSNPRV